MALFDDFLRSVAQMFSARFIWVLLKSVLLTLLLLVGVSYGLWFLMGVVVPESFVLPFIGEVTFLDDVLSVAAIPALLVLSAVAMFPVAALFIGLFLDEIASAVEKRHYKALPPARRVPLSETLYDVVQFAGVFLLVNLVALLIYFLVAPLAPFIFWIVNGYLLGREYFSQVAIRRLPRIQAKALRRRHRFRVWFAGILMAVPLSVPVLNLIVPILGVATFTHQFQRLSQQSGLEPAP